jgi:predicted amidohydrolase YtcJ
LAHVQIVDDADQARLARLKPLISSTGIWCIRFQEVEKAIGTDRYNKMFRFGRLQRDHGLNVALGSDWPATYASGTLGIEPMLNVQAAILRQPPPPLLEAMKGSLGPNASEPLPPMQDAFTLNGALEAYTIAGARQMGIDGITGSIKVGKRADLCVLDRDLTRLPADEIYSARCRLTLMDGVARHDARQTT